MQRARGHAEHAGPSAAQGSASGPSSHWPARNNGTTATSAAVDVLTAKGRATPSAAPAPAPSAASAPAPAPALSSPATPAPTPAVPPPNPPASPSRIGVEVAEVVVDEAEDVSDAAITTAELLGLVSFDEHMKAERARMERLGPAVPVFVMLPLNAVKADGALNNPEGLRAAFKALSNIGVKGVMVDVWWGVVEREGPQQYDWEAYKELTLIAKLYGLKIQAVMSFHACGANVGDDVDIKLPQWVCDAARANPHLTYRDQHGYHNPECLSLWADHVPDLFGRTPLQCYADFMTSFRDALAPEIGDTISDICIGCGPCGELRYPSYPENRREPTGSQWRFPGVGEFQCYDKYSLDSLRENAEKLGKPKWGLCGPHDAGGYNDWPESTGFFRSQGGSWDSEYGHFFMDWYSRSLADHGERMVDLGASIFKRTRVQLSIKLAGVHWWYNSRSHAAELTAGYYNIRSGELVRAHNGYDRLCKMLGKYNARLNFTCVEMRDHEHPELALCSPEGLLRQVRLTAAKYGVSISGENALCRFDADAHNQIVVNAIENKEFTPLSEFTFLRLFPEFFDERNFRPFMDLVRRMKGLGSTEEEPDVQLKNYEDFLEFDERRKAQKGGKGKGDGYLLFRF